MASFFVVTFTDLLGELVDLLPYFLSLRIFHSLPLQQPCFLGYSMSCFSL